MEAYTRTRGRFPGCSRVRGCVLEVAQAMFSIDEIPVFTWKIARCPLQCDLSDQHCAWCLCTCEDCSEKCGEARVWRLSM